jgi:hypothetical protein
MNTGLLYQIYLKIIEYDLQKTIKKYKLILPSFVTTLSVVAQLYGHGLQIRAIVVGTYPSYRVTNIDTLPHYLTYIHYHFGERGLILYIGYQQFPNCHLFLILKNIQ